jgi:di/tricarboxylate transporter
VGPLSQLAGHSIAEADLRSKHGVIVLALHRRGENLREQLTKIPLRSGDVLLIEASESAISALRQSNDLLVLAGGQRRFRRSKRWIATLAVVCVVVASAFQALPVAVVALLAAVLVVATRCVDTEDAYRSIDWPCLFLVAGMLAIGAALEKTHAAALLAEAMVPHVAPLGPWFALTLWIVIASVFTNFLTNNAVAALLIPLAVETAHLLHVNPRAYLIGVTLGASACFATPIGYQTNTLVFTAGGYRFSDFLRIGLPLNIIYCAVASYLIPYFWPL